MLWTTVDNDQSSGENVKVMLETKILSSQTSSKHSNNKDYITGLSGYESLSFFVQDTILF